MIPPINDKLISRQLYHFRLCRICKRVYVQRQQAGLRTVLAPQTAFSSIRGMTALWNITLGQCITCQQFTVYY
jgi:hypothetical protein